MGSRLPSTKVGFTGTQAKVPAVIGTGTMR